MPPLNQKQTPIAAPLTTKQLRDRFESLVKATAPQLFGYWQELEASIDKDTAALRLSKDAETNAKIIAAQNPPMPPAVPQKTGG